MKYPRKTKIGHTRAIKNREGYSEAYLNGECLGTFGDEQLAYKAIDKALKAIPKQSNKPWE